MRKILAVLLLLTGFAGATTVTVTGTVNGADNNPLPSGTIVFTLPFSARDTSTNHFVTSSPQIPFAVANGQIQPGATLIPNDVLQPSGYYIVQVFDPGGNLLGMSNAVIPTGGGTYDIGQATPTSVLTSNVSYISPANLAGNNTWSGSNTFSQPIISTVATGLSPFIIASTTKVANLWVAGLISDSANIPSAGVIRLGAVDQACWGTTASGNKCLKSTDNSPGLVVNFNSTDNPVGMSTYAYVVGGLPVSISGTGSETILGTTTSVVANSVGPAAPTRQIRLHFSGTIFNSSGGNITYTFRVRPDSTGGTVLCSSAGVVVATGVSNAPWHLDCLITAYTTGVTGTVDAWGTYTVNATTGDVAQATPVTFDTTISHTFVLTTQMSVSSSNGFSKLFAGTLEKLGLQP